MKRQLLTFESTTILKLAFLSSFFLSASVGLAQHHRGHVGGATNGGMHSGTFTRPGLMNGTQGVFHGSELNPMTYPNTFDAYRGGGFGGVVPFPVDPNAMGGMTLQEQEAFKQMRANELMNRSNLEAMQAAQAGQIANLANQQANAIRNGQGVQPASGVRANGVIGIGSFVMLDQVRWPVRAKLSDGAVYDKQQAAGKAVLAVHMQAMTKGHAQPELVLAAKTKLRELSTALSRASRVKPVNKSNLLDFISNLDGALDGTLRSTSEKTAEQSSPKPIGAENK